MQVTYALIDSHKKVKMYIDMKFVIVCELGAMTNACK